MLEASSPITFKFYVTFALFLGHLLVRLMGARLITRSPWNIYFRNATGMMSFALLLLIWHVELARFAFSIIVVASAIAIATKDFVLCVMGGFYKMSNRLFKIGDRIEVGDNLGDVVDSNLFYTKLLEVGPKGLSQRYTGRTVAIPNKLFLNQSIHNLTSSKRYSFHVFRHPVELSDDILIKKKIMYQAALDVSTPYMEEARFEMRQAALKEGLVPQNIGPIVSLHFEGPKEVHLVVRVPVPVKRRGHYQQKVLHRYLERVGHPRRQRSGRAAGTGRERARPYTSPGK